MANPPYGVTWKKDQQFVLNESLDPNGRFTAGTPRVSDGQLLFLQHMISKMEPDGARIGIVTNGSPLFSGGAGSGESNIRKWIIENDWLDAIVALPKDLFYNTGISTYIWFLTNKKPEARRGKVQLINAVDFCHPAKKSLGNKRNDILEDNIDRILALYLDFQEGEYCKIFDNKFFGSYEMTVCQPERDAKGCVVKKRNGEKVMAKSDTENIALNTDWKAYFKDEVLPHIDPESWVDISKTKISYEINFSRYFYQHEQLRSSEDIAADITLREKRIQNIRTPGLIGWEGFRAIGRFYLQKDYSIFLVGLPLAPIKRIIGMEILYGLRLLIIIQPTTIYLLGAVQFLKKDTVPALLKWFPKVALYSLKELLLVKFASPMLIYVPIKAVFAAYLLRM
jgi:type I restriction enzyme M protein